jgi:hypothetical protein
MMLNNAVWIFFRVRILFRVLVLLAHLTPAGLPEFAPDIFPVFLADDSR